MSPSDAPMVTGTLEELSSTPVAQVRLLTYVLSYDDLLAGASVGFRIGGAKLAIGRAVTEGPAAMTAPGELRLPDRWMSGAHAVIEARGDGDIIRDLDSRNGTWVDGVRVREERLVSGALIEVGHSLLCYRVVDEREAAALDGAEPRLGPIRTWSPAVAAVVRDLERIARSRESVLLLAETGAGKEIAAAAIHTWSGRTGALCPVDCGAIPESLFESTFFGHRRGAFTGATDARDGEIVRADRGTLMLDEVANMGRAAQAKLLRVIETGEVTPVGASEPRAVDVRWLAATNRDLLADDDGFRPDLLRRLAGHVARIPPLRERREDLGLLAAHLLRDAGVGRATITATAARALFTAPLPGNVRQLRTVLRSAAILAGDGAIEPRHLGEGLAGPATAAGASSPLPTGATPLDDEVAMGGRAPRATPTADEVTAALEASGGNVVRAATALGTHPRQLYRWIDRFGLDLERYRG